MCVFFFYIVLVQSVTHEYVNRNALSMFKALNKVFKLKMLILLLNQVEGRLKSLD